MTEQHMMIKSEHMMMNQGNMPTSFTDIFSGNNIFSFDDMNAAALQAMTMDQDMFNAPSSHMSLDMETNQEVLLSSILSPPMDDSVFNPACFSSAMMSPLSPIKKKSPVRSRDWKVISCTEDLQCLLTEDTVKIAIKTRDDKQANFNVPDKLYSSLRYVLSQKLDSAFLANKQTVLMSKIQIVNPQTQEEIRKKNNEYVIDKGNTMVELKYNADTKCYECTEKIKFLDNSYRHNDIKFAFRVSFYDASQPAFLTKSPILELLSAPFHVRARRPPKNKRDEEEEEEEEEESIEPSTSSVPVKLSKKRKSEDMPEGEDTKKRVKLMLKPLQTSHPLLPLSIAQPSPNSSKRILNLLEKLAFSINSLPDSEKDTALELARKKLGNIETLKQPVPLDALSCGSDSDLTAYSTEEFLSFEKFI